MTTNNTIYTDSRISDDERRQALYAGQVFVYLRSPAVTRFVEFTRALLERTFTHLDPRLAQHELPVGRFAEIPGDLNPGNAPYAVHDHQLRKAVR